MTHSRPVTPGAAAADVDLARRVVKVDPLAIVRGDDALRAQHGAVSGLVLERGERSAQTVLGELLRRFHAPGREHLVRVVAVVMVMMAAAALVIVVVLVVLVMVVLMVVAAAAFLAVIVMMLMLVLIVVVVMMLVLMLIVVIIVVIVIVVMAAAGAAAVFIEMMMVLMVMMMVMLVLVLVLFVLALNAFKRGGERVALFHRVEDLRAGELRPTAS